MDNGLNHVCVLAQAVSGSADIDEQVYESASILAGKLEDLKSYGELFQGVSFSPEAMQIVKECNQLV